MNLNYAQLAFVYPTLTGNVYTLPAMLLLFERLLKRVFFILLLTIQNIQHCLFGLKKLFS